MKKLFLILSFISSASVIAQEESVDPTRPLQVTVSTKKVFMHGVKEDKIEAVRADVGDVIEYSLSYKNASSSVVRNVKAALPIPNGYTYVQGSAAPNLDGTPTSGNLVWTLGSLQPKATVTVTARLKLTKVPK